MTTNYKETRLIKLTGPSEAIQGLKVLALSGREEISRPFRYDVSLAGVGGKWAQGTGQPDDILGAHVSVGLYDARNRPLRIFSGIVTEFEYLGYGLRHLEYRAVLRPQFWLLTRNVDCRVLQNASTPDIFGELAKGGRGLKHSLKLTRDYQRWDQRIQYMESDFAFLSRLLEHDGIYYYFEHENGSHNMVLVDAVAKLQPMPGYEKVRYLPVQSDFEGGEGLRHVMLSKSLESPGVGVRDFDFEKPGSLPTSAANVEDVAEAGLRFDLYEYPADVHPVSQKEVERIAKLRAERVQTSQTVLRGEGDVPGLCAGYVFELKDHPIQSLNKKYLVVAANVQMSSAEDDTAAADFRVSIEAIDARTPYRPERLTPKPRIYGAQTAIVVGEDKDEVLTDKYGRIKVTFHWDRVGTKSWWVRVAQGWAGKNWGMQFLPRAGQEVVVSFLQGDPDQGVVVGSVYNGDHLPPYALPSQKTRSGVKSRSTPEGSAETFNEIRFEDKKGEEELYIHAEKNMQVVVENDQVLTIGTSKKDKGDRTTTIYNDDTLTVGNDRKVTVKHALETTVEDKETRTVKKSRKTTVKENDETDVTKKYTLSAGDEITLKVGQAKIVLKKDGSIEIAGLNVKISGKAKLEADSPQTTVSGTQLNVKGTRTAVEGTAMLDVTSSGVASLKGTLTKIG
jgi:type VI secretion system secreted protein VgrG